tara:strand:+ start:4685 stop:5440 length:756 start_codon:yes stop_codon:yes gene_type:complete
MKTKREEIEYHNRRFKFNLSGKGADNQPGLNAGSCVCKFTFKIQPPNEFAFSSRFHQALVKINRVYLSNRIDAFAFGSNSVFTTRAAAPNIRPCGAGILLVSDINTMNNSSAIANADRQRNSCLQVLIPNTGGMGSGAAIGLAGAGVCGGAHLVRRDAAGAGDADLVEDYYTPQSWTYQDDRPIEEAGVLCGNIFSRDITFECEDPLDGARLMMDAPTAAGAVGNAVNANSKEVAINIELEVLMLENPRAE